VAHTGLLRSIRSAGCFATHSLTRAGLTLVTNRTVTGQPYYLIRALLVKSKKRKPLKSKYPRRGASLLWSSKSFFSPIHALRIGEAGRGSRFFRFRFHSGTPWPAKLSFAVRYQTKCCNRSKIYFFFDFPFAVACARFSATRNFTILRSKSSGSGWSSGNCTLPLALG